MNTVSEMTVPSRGRRRIVTGLLVLVVGGMILWRLQFMFASRPSVGLVDGRLRPCPSSPNCVCSQDADAGHTVLPLRFTGPARTAWDHLHQVIQAMPRTRILEVSDHYLRVEFTTPLLRFVDDVEFLLDGAENKIHVRSASRVGYSDLGTNRKRVESVRAAFEARLQ